MDAAQPSSNRDWVEQELGEVRLGDARLDRRLLETATRMADRPTASNPQRLDWNELRGLSHVAHAPPFVDAVARLGGYLGRKGDGPLGWETLWRGYQRLKDVLLGAELMRETTDGDPSADENTPRDPPSGARDAIRRPE